MSSAVDSSNHTTSSHGNILPKFSDYRSRVMLGDLPQDFLRIQLVESQVYGPSVFDHALEHDSNFIGYFTFSITEAKLIKNSGPLGLLRMDPYVRFQIGSISNETPTATGGGKNPQWNASYRINLFKEIPQEVISGQTKLSWYPLMGRETSANENQGEILVMMSLMPIISDQSSDMDDVNLLNSSTGSSSASSPSNSVIESAAMYSSDDIRTIEEMFPAIDRQIIIDLLEKHGGNKDLVVNNLLQNSVS
ncbi:unnamed protein product [Rotaria magnacalcarata]|uniref:CUE domain-containing protein n=1 Tax=Rotaria magnacalcarata TaxID=392030 RepID=A0A8S2P7G3_9BILA|nr:unnamed protein product [Rotaria magnacalcarata]